MNADGALLARAETADELPAYRRNLREALINRRWIARNIDALIATYRDRWIVVDEEQIIGVGDTADAAIAACERAVNDVTAIVLLVPREVHRPI